MNPLMTEDRIVELIDEVVANHNNQLTGVCLRLNWAHKIYSLNYSSDELAKDLFDLSLRKVYISNVCFYRHFITVNLKIGLYGRDSNYGVRTIEKLLELAKRPSI